jgi:hypothetical protein
MLSIEAPGDIQWAESQLSSPGIPVRKISEYNPRFNSGGYFSDVEKMIQTNYTRERWNTTSESESVNETPFKHKTNTHVLETTRLGRTFYTPLRNEPVFIKYTEPDDKILINSTSSVIPF